MQRHPVDLVSLVFGILFLGTVGVATMIGELGWDRFTANAWLVPVGVILLGVLLLVSSLRSATAGSSTTSETSGTDGTHR
jgi:protein-S-isoprenylcysteine O-methyltransferase Ste14